jgi:hypothetical protein
MANVSAWHSISVTLQERSLLLVALFLAGCKGSAGPMGPEGSGIPSYTAVFQYQVSPSVNYVEVRTTFVNAADPTTPGNDTDLWVGSGPTNADWIRSLLRFDVTSLPTNAEVQGAYLRLWYAGGSLSTTDSLSVGLYEVTCPWDETATWNDRATSFPWGTCVGPGNEPFTRGQSFEANPMDIMTFDDALGRYLALNLVPAVVQGWVDTPIDNWGVVLASVGEGMAGVDWVNFYSRSFGDQGPALVVTYTIP